MSFLRPRRHSHHIRTARCLLTDGDRHLLVVHAGAGRRHHPRWGLPGGHLDPGEDPETAVRRELEEELELSVGALEMIDDYRYKGALHRVYTGLLPRPIERFDTSELLQIGWHTAHDIEQFARSGTLHAGYEHQVVRALMMPRRAAG